MRTGAEVPSWGALAHWGFSRQNAQILVPSALQVARELLGSTHPTTRGTWVFVPQHRDKTKHVLCAPGCGKVWEIHVNPFSWLSCFLSPFPTLRKSSAWTSLRWNPRAISSAQVFHHVTCMFFIVAPPLVALILIMRGLLHLPL